MQFNCKWSNSAAKVSESQSTENMLSALQVVSKPDLGRSGVYWSWNKENGSFENELSEESSDLTKAKKLYDISLKLVGLS